jgi:hypothetical protein
MKPQVEETGKGSRTHLPEELMGPSPSSGTDWEVLSRDCDAIHEPVNNALSVADSIFRVFAMSS